MAVVRAAAAPPSPRRWSDQHPVLEQQHDRLESLLQELLQRHEAEGPPAIPLQHWPSKRPAGDCSGICVCSCGLRSAGCVRRDVDVRGNLPAIGLCARHIPRQSQSTDQ